MTVEELRAHLQTMRQLMANSESDGLNLSIDDDGNPTSARSARRNQSSKASIIDGTFLSLVFSVVLVLIVGVSFYAFQNLYQAILKKFPSLTHTEL